MKTQNGACPPASTRSWVDELLPMYCSVHSNLHGIDGMIVVNEYRIVSQIFFSTIIPCAPVHNYSSLVPSSERIHGHVFACLFVYMCAVLACMQRF